MWRVKDPKTCYNLNSGLICLSSLLSRSFALVLSRSLTLLLSLSLVRFPPTSLPPLPPVSLFSLLLDALACGHALSVGMAISVRFASSLRRSATHQCLRPHAANLFRGEYLFM